MRISHRRSPALHPQADQVRYMEKLKALQAQSIDEQSKTFLRAFVEDFQGNFARLHLASCDLFFLADYRQL